MDRAEKASLGLAIKGKIFGLKKQNINQLSYKWCLLFTVLDGI
jgi:hypothetical protein